MKKIIGFGLLVVTFISVRGLALSLSSDTSQGSLSFTEILTAEGDFNTRRTLRNSAIKGVWSFDYNLTQTTTANPNGSDIKDNTSEFDASLGQEKKDSYEYGVGLTYATTPQENLRDLGPDVYAGFTIPLGEKTESFAPEVSFKLTLSQLTYTQTFSSTTTSRRGRILPTTGSSSIGQFFPKIEAYFDIVSALSIKLAYTYYSYNRNVNDFLQTLDSPRAVAVGLGNLGSSVSGFNTDMKEIDAMLYPFDDWEFDLQTTEATSAIDSSAGWTYKVNVWYDFSKNWRGGLAYENETNFLLTDNIGTASVKYTFE